MQPPKHTPSSSSSLTSSATAAPSSKPSTPTSSTAPPTSRYRRSLAATTWQACWLAIPRGSWRLLRVEIPRGQWILEMRFVGRRGLWRRGKYAWGERWGKGFNPPALARLVVLFPVFNTTRGKNSRILWDVTGLCQDRFQYTCAWLAWISCRRCRYFVAGRVIKLDIFQIPKACHTERSCPSLPGSAGCKTLAHYQ